MDTYDTIKGVQNAIKVGHALKANGKKLLGVRIDSGDLAYYSNMARELLDEAGFTDTKVVASNDLDEHILSSLKMQEASIDIWGIGTKLVTAYDQPALGAVYKMAALKDEQGNWVPKVKVSQQSIKINIPGFHNVKRFYKNDKAISDMIYLESNEELAEELTIIDPYDPTKRRKINPNDMESKDLLVPIFKKGKKVYSRPKLEDIRNSTLTNLRRFDKAHKRLINPHIYPVGLEEGLYHLRTDLVLKAKNYS